MENEEKLLGFVGTVSERAGVLTSKVVDIGSKVAGLASSGISAGKEMIGLANQKTKGANEKKSVATRKTKMKSDPAAVRQKPNPDKSGKKQAKLESQLKKLKAENQSLMSELDQVRSELSETRSGEGAARARAAALEAELDLAKQQLEQVQNEAVKTKEQEQTETADRIAKLESDLAAAQHKLEETRDEAKEIQTHLKSQLKEMQVEKESLLTELEIAQKDSGEIETREKILTEEIAELESELEATQRELSETRSQAKKTHSELASQLEDLRAERESLISDLENARNQAGGERLRAHSMEAQIVSLKAEIAAFDLESEKVREKESGVEIDVARNQPEIEKVPMEQISESSIKAADYEESFIENVQNVEGQEPETILESEADIDAEETGPEPGIEAAELLKVTSEEVQAADFKDEHDKILFTKAFSDFTSLEATSRAEAAGIIAGIRHVLSLRLLITHMAGEPSAMVRQKCVEAISRLEMKEGISAIECALGDKAASVRLAAVWGLYRLAGTESIPTLIPMLSDSDISVRRRAITCTGWVGGHIAKAGTHHRPRVISALVKRLNDPSESVRNAALNSLQAVTGKKMPASRTSPERLIGQWQKWWQAELSG